MNRVYIPKTLAFFLSALLFSYPTFAKQGFKVIEGEVSFLGASGAGDFALIEKDHKVMSYSVKTGKFRELNSESGWTPIESGWDYPWSMDYVILRKGNSFKLLKVGDKATSVTPNPLISIDFKSVKNAFYKEYAVFSFNKHFLVLKSGRLLKIQKSTKFGQEQSADVNSDILMATYTRGVEFFNLNTGKSIYKTALKGTSLSGRLLNREVAWIYNDQNAIYAVEFKRREVTFLWDKEGAWYQKFSPLGILSIWNVDIPDKYDNTRGILVVTENFRGKEIFRLPLKIDNIEVGRIEDTNMVGDKLFISGRKYRTSRPILIIADLPPKPHLRGNR